jgi:gliding motility-associated-like protein
MKKVFLILPFLIFSEVLIYSQVNYQVRLDELYSYADDSDGAGGEDIAAYIDLNDNAGGALLSTGCIYRDSKNSGTWYTAVTSGMSMPNTWTTVNNSNSTFFTSNVDFWEEDGGCNSECEFGTGFFCNDDEGRAQGSAGNINFIADPPCTWTQYTLSILGGDINMVPADYRAHYSVYWEPTTMDAGVIAGDQTVCSNGDPIAFTSSDPGVVADYPAYYTYQWQKDVGCTGTFIDIGSANGDTYNVPIGITQTTCYRRVTKSTNCSDIMSNTLTITVASASTAPSTINSTETILCGAGVIDLNVVGGSLAAGDAWVWYDGDPNGTGVSIGTNSPLSNYVVSATTTFFVRAEGACGNTATASLLVTVNTPTSDPTSVTSSSLSTCVGTAVDLTINGGAIGSGVGAVWAWYNTDPSIGTPTPIYTDPFPTYNVSPTVSTTYYVRGEGCDTSLAVSVAINVDLLSTDPTGVNVVTPLICNGGNTDLTVQGGSLGTGATWQWYEVGCGSGTAINSGPTITVAPIVTTTYYVRAEGTCGSSNCSSITVTVSQATTVDPTNVTTPSLVVCVGSPIDLTVNAPGTLGSGAVWAWYNTDPSIGTPSPIYVNASPIYSISPVLSTTYYVRGEGCDTSVAVQTTITVTDPSIPPSGINATQTSFCAGGGSSTLSIPDGTLGAAASWAWYADGCGAGSIIGSGTSITVSPTVTTTYYVRAEGGCNGNTTCVNIEISIDAPSVNPASIVSPNTDLCLGETTVLSVSGGTLGTGATWEWFQGSCGGISVGQGTSISVLPSVTTIYYVRAEGVCGNTICVDIIVSVGVGAANPTSAAVSVNNICPGDTTQLTVTGPVLNPGYTWVWYTGACGAVPAGVGTTLDVFPTITTTYYVRAVGTCGQTNCVSVTVYVLDAAIMANGITASNNYFCTGDSALLELYGGTLVAGAGWVWYENSCGGTPIGTGTTITVSPATNTAYFVRAEGGACGNTACVNISINVLDAYAYMVPFDTLCGMGYPFDLANGVPEGGVYSGTGITNGIFDPILAGLGTHAVTYTFTEDNGCIAITTGEIVIDSNDIVASVTIVPETCAEGGITLVGSTYGGSGFYIYEWSNGFIGNPLEYVDAGTYSVIVVDGSNCVSIIPDIVVDEDFTCIEMPNSFTPNNDGTNDMWNLDFSGYSNGSIQVYSKWGTLVWESSGTTLSWDGTSNGQVLPSGTYYYILDIDNGSLTQNGPVTIVK